MTFPNSSYDPSLVKIATSTRVSTCSADPADYAGIAAVSLGEKALTAGDGNGDWVIADGDTSGRKVSMTEQTAVEATGNGNVLFYVWDDGSELRGSVPVASQAVTTGQIWRLPATKVLEIKDPVYV